MRWYIIQGNAAGTLSEYRASTPPRLISSPSAQASASSAAAIDNQTHIAIRIPDLLISAHIDQDYVSVYQVLTAFGTLVYNGKAFYNHEGTATNVAKRMN